MGILNLTNDSFSDGGRFLDPGAALAHADSLLQGGADVVDIGAQASNPQAQGVSATAEVERLTPVVRALKQRGVAVSIDTFRAPVMSAMLALGVDYINDITGFARPESIEAVRASDAKLIVMHAVDCTVANASLPDSRAEPLEIHPDYIVDHVEDWLRTRVEKIVTAGIARERLIIDPGMGLFLGREVRLSVNLLRALPRLTQFGLPILISVSRKSFIGALLRQPDAPPVPPDLRQFGTLAAELFAADQRAAIIRTHDPAALRDALRVHHALTREAHAESRGRRDQSADEPGFSVGR